MSTGPTQGGKKPQVVVDADDPWGRLTREARAAQTGGNVDSEELGDTARLISGQHAAIHVTATYQRAEMLKLVNDSLSAAPERGDLWMMRFEVQKSLGMKQEFVEGLVAGWKNPVVYRQLDWAVLRMMWHELAPGEPLPEIIRLPDSVSQAEPLRPIAQQTGTSTARIRRFADIAQKIAERELTVLNKAYTALAARPGFFEEFARRTMPLLKRPTPLAYAESLSKNVGEHVRIFLKREDRRGFSAEQDHAVAQCYIATLLGRTQVVTANDVDEHALAVAEMAPHFKLSCTVIVRPDDFRDKHALVNKLKAAGVKVEPMPESGMLGTDPREGAVRHWQRAGGAAHLVLSMGTAPPPYPQMANAFQSLMGHETELQFRPLARPDRPRTMVAAVESEADSLGFVLPQLGRREVELVYAEPEPGGVASWRASLRLRAYNGAIREHTLLYGTGRVQHVPLADSQADAIRERMRRGDDMDLSLEDSRAVALTLLLTQRDKSPRDFIVLVA